MVAKLPFGALGMFTFPPGESAWVALIFCPVHLTGRRVIKLSSFALFQLLVSYHVFYYIYYTLDLIACLCLLLFFCVDVCL